MSEESILILNMLREGKITAEQADSLLRAVRETGAPPPPSAPPPPPNIPPTPDTAAMASMQAKLAELQGKLGELQGKLGVAQATKAAGQAASLAGKMLDHIPRPDLDMSKINKAVDEAMRGLNSLKNDALRTAKTAGRQASQEARRAAREGRKAFRFDLNMDFGSIGAEERPGNTSGQPEATETSHTSVSWSGADRLILENKYGSIKIVGVESQDAAAEAVITKTAWAGTEAEARVLLQQVFLTHQVENGRCKIGIAAPQDARDRLTVDYEIALPHLIPMEVTTTFGAVAVDQAGGEMKLSTQSGAVQVIEWGGSSKSLLIETVSGDIHAGGLNGETVSLSTRSGDINAQEIEMTGTATVESASGDVTLASATVATRAFVRTQSGHATVHSLRAEQIQLETVSGDAEVRDSTGTMTVKTVSGDIEAAQIDSQTVSVLTVSGDANWAFAAPFSGSFAGTTVSGDLALTLSNGSNARIEMNTTSGDLTLSLPLTEPVITERHTAGKLGEGLGSIRLQSVSGDLKVAEA